jgi:hypothetical protein
LNRDGSRYSADDAGVAGVAADGGDAGGAGGERRGLDLASKLKLPKLQRMFPVVWDDEVQLLASCIVLFWKNPGQNPTFFTISSTEMWGRV